MTSTAKERSSHQSQDEYHWRKDGELDRRKAPAIGEYPVSEVVNTRVSHGHRVVTAWRPFSGTSTAVGAEGDWAGPTPGFALRSR